MAEATQYSFTHQDLIKLMIRQQGLHDGLWQLVVNFGFGASAVGPNPNELNPGALVVIQGLGIQKATEKTNLTVDASEANPA